MAVALIKGGVDVDDHCQTLGSPLSFTLRDCDKGQPGMIEALLDHGADINQKDAEQMTPLQRVIEDHHVASLWILLERGVDVNTKFSTCEMGCSPLILAAKTTRIHHPSRPEHRNLRDEIGLLRTNVCRSTIKMVLTEIHSRNDFDELEILLALGAEVDASCERCGITALEVAIEAENLRAENILRRYGATRPFIASILPLKYLQ
jgi:ankyrin repeat protein